MSTEIEFSTYNERQEVDAFTAKVRAALPEIEKLNRSSLSKLQDSLKGLARSSVTEVAGATSQVQKHLDGMQAMLGKRGRVKLGWEQDFRASAKAVLLEMDNLHSVMNAKTVAQGSVAAALAAAAQAKLAAVEAEGLRKRKEHARLFEDSPVLTQSAQTNKLAKLRESENQIAKVLADARRDQLNARRDHEVKLAEAETLAQATRRAEVLEVEALERRAAKAAKVQKSLAANGKEAQAVITAGPSSLAASALSDLNQTLSKTPEKSAAVSSAFKKLTIDGNDVHSMARGLASGFNLLWLTWGNLVPLLAGSAASFSVVKSFKFGAELEQSLYVVQELAGATTAETKALSDQMLELGKTSKYGATEAAKGLEILMLAGLNARDAATALEPTLRFASAGQVTIKQAAETSVAVATAYGYSARQLESVNDIILKTATDTMASVEGMSESFKSSSVLAQSYGVSLRDTSQALGDLAQIGITGSAAGTSMRNFYTELTKEGGKVGELLDTLKVKVTDSSGAAKPYLEITRDLTSAMINLSGGMQLQAEKTLANERGGKLMSAGIANMTAEVKKSQQGLLDQADAAAKAGNKLEAHKLRVEAVANAYEILKSKANVQLAEAAGSTFRAALEDNMKPLAMMKGITASLETQLIKAFQNSLPAITLFALSVREAVNSEAFLNGVTSLVSGVVDFGRALVDAAKFAIENQTAILALTGAYIAYKINLLEVVAVNTAKVLGLGASTAVTTANTAATTANGLATMLGLQGTTASTLALRAKEVTWLGVTGATIAHTAATAADTAATVAATSAKVALGLALGGVAIGLTAGAAALLAYALYADKATESEERLRDAQLADSKKRIEATKAQVDFTLKSVDDEIAASETKLTALKAGASVEEAQQKVIAEAAQNRIKSLYQEMMTVERLTLQQRILNAARANLDAGYEEALVNGLIAESQGKVLGLWDEQNAALTQQANKYSTLNKLKLAAANLAEVEAKRKVGKPQGSESLDLSESKALKAQKATRQELTSAKAIDSIGYIYTEHKAELDAITTHEASKKRLLEKSYNGNLITQATFIHDTLAATQYAEAASLEVLERSNSKILEETERYMGLREARYIEELSRSKLTGSARVEFETALFEKFYEDTLKLHQKETSSLAQNEEQKQAILTRAKERRQMLVLDEAIATKKAIDDATEYWRKSDTADARNRAADAVAEGWRLVGENATAGAKAEKAAALAGIATANSHAAALEDLVNSAEKTKLALAELESLYEFKSQTGLLSAEEEAHLTALRDRRVLDEKLVEDHKLKSGERVAKAASEAYRKSMQAEVDRLANGVSDAIEAALFEGGQAGKRKLRDLIVAELRRPIRMEIDAVVTSYIRPVIGKVLGSVVGGDSDALDTASNLWSAGSNLFGTSGAGVGTVSMANAVGAAGGDTLGALIAGNSSSWGVSAAGVQGGSLMSGIGAAAPWLLGGLTVLKLLSSMDDSGTIHTGGLSQYSAAGGLKTSTQHGAFGMGFGGVDLGKDTQNMTSELSKTVVNLLDANAVAFGKTAGYEVATAFADDTSKDGAWGGLLIKDVFGKAAVNWDDSRTSRWAPKEFADGAEGAKQYAAAVALDVRNVLLEQTPDWADTMLNALGDAPSLENLALTVSQITAVSVALAGIRRASESLGEVLTNSLLSALGGGQAAAQTLSSYYTNFYSETDRAALATAQLTEDMAAFGQTLPGSRQAFRNLVDAAAAAGDTALVASLLMVEGRFAALVPAITAADQAIADNLARLGSESKTLQRELLEAKGGDLRAFDTAGYTAAELALYDYNKALESQIETQRAATEAAKVAVTTLRETVSQMLDEVKTRADSVLSAESAVADAQLQAASDVARATNEAARAMAQASRNLRDYVFGQTETAQQSYQKILTRALGGDAEAMQALPGAATAATEAAKARATSAVDYARQRALVLQGVLAAADVAQSRSGLVSEPATKDPLQAAVSALEVAVVNLSRSVSQSISLDLVNKLGEIDLDGDLSIKFTELQAQFGGLASEATLKTVFNKLDTDGSGQIGLLEAIRGNTFNAVNATQLLALSVSALQSGQLSAKDFTTTVSDLAASSGGTILQNSSTSVTTSTGSEQVYVSSGGAVAVGGTIYDTTGASYSTESAISAVNSWLAAGDPMTVYLEAVKRGISSSSLDAMMGWPAGTSLGWASSQGLPAFAVGTNYVPHDMIAQIHEGEAIVPKAYNPAAGHDQNSALVAEIRALRVEVQGLRAEARATAVNTGRSQDLLKRVTRNGEAMQTEVTA